MSCLMRQLKKSKRPAVRLLDIAAQTDAGEGIRQALEDMRKGRVRPAKEFFAEFETRHGLSC